MIVFVDTYNWRVVRVLLAWPCSSRFQPEHSDHTLAWVELPTTMENHHPIDLAKINAVYTF